MARGRMISKSLGSSRKFHELHGKAGKLGDFAQLLFPLLVISADDFGRLDGDAFTVKHSIFPTSPHSEREFESALKAMHEVGLIQLYHANSKRYIAIVNFDREQPGLHKRTQSRLPAPPAILEFPANSGKFLEDEGISRPIEENRTELEQKTTLLPPGGGEGKEMASPKPRPADPLWDALVSVLGAGPATASERGAWNLAAKQLREAGATPDQVRQRAQNYRDRYRDAALTPTALAKHWGSLSIRAPAIAGTAQSREQRLAELAVIEERIKLEEQQRKSHAAT